MAGICAATVHHYLTSKGARPTWSSPWAANIGRYTHHEYQAIIPYELRQKVNLNVAL